MPSYKRISNRLIMDMCEIIDKAKAAVEAAEESIISDETNVTVRIAPEKVEE